MENKIKDFLNNCFNNSVKGDLFFVDKEGKKLEKLQTKS